jgi:energy-coupling factor transporter ATP-binding protein EcfA2
VVELKNVNFGYEPDKLIFENVNCFFTPGKVHVIAGKSGVGKTTLLDLIFGFLKPDAGEIYFGQEQVKGVLSDKAAYLVADPEKYFFEPSVVEEVAFPLRFNGFLKEEAKIRAVQILSKLGLDERIWLSNPNQLSKGLKRKVALASTLVLGRELVLLDEPLAGLDRKGRKMVADLLGDIVSSGRTVIMTAHSFDELLELKPEIHLVLERKIFIVDMNQPKDALNLFYRAGLIPPEKLKLAVEMVKKGFYLSVFQSDEEFVKKAVELLLKNEG